MAGKIVADTLEHSTAGSIATNYVVEGSAKAWVVFSQSGPTTSDSFNITSVSDDATGQFTPSFTSSFDNANYAVTGTVKRSGGGNARTNYTYDSTATGSFGAFTFQTATDDAYHDTPSSSSVHGDLA